MARDDEAKKHSGHAPKHPERIEETWPTYEGGDEHPVSELAAEVQGAEPPFGSDVHPPVPIERHGLRWTVREEGTARHDTDY